MSSGQSATREASAIIGELRRIVSDHGVERLEKVMIGGVPQWVSIRGSDIRNPVLLMLHGGPGYVSMPTSWYFQRGWEDYFTMVQWDQPGAGKTYREASPEYWRQTLTADRVLADSEALVAWIRAELGQDRIFLLGHSWGSFLGLTLASHKPEWLHAYIGVAQAVDSVESERRSWQFVIEAARAAGNGGALLELSSATPSDAENVSYETLMMQRHWLSLFGGAVHNRAGFEAEVNAAALAPEYSDEDLATVWEANELSTRLLLDALLDVDLRHVTELQCPIVLMLGRHDRNVSSEVAAEWFDELRAPAKSLVWFENSAHEVFIEEPGRALVALVQHALPHANNAPR